jgi:hypothetical protein
LINKNVGHYFKAPYLYDSQNLEYQNYYLTLLKFDEMNVIADKVNFDVADFDEEIVIVNIHKGIYYSLKGGAPYFFRLFIAGVDLSQFNTLFEEKYSVEKSNLFTEFVNLLLAEELLVVTKEGVQELHFEFPSIQLLDEGFIVEKQDDISDLIKLDPIHDVSPDKGWPNLKD